MKFFVIFTLFMAAEISAKILPDFIPQCKRKDPEFVKCALAAVDKVKPYLLKGIPEIRVPPYDPLEIPNLTVDRDLEAVRVKASLNGMKVYGPSGFKIKNLKIDLEKYTAELMISLPNLYVTSDYDVSGRLLLIPLGGKGKLEGNFTDCSAFTKGQAKVVTKKGVEVLQIEKFNSKIKIGGGNVKFEATDGTSALIAQTAAIFFNANPRLVLDIINPIIEDTSDVILIAIINRIFGVIPISELIPEE